MKGALFRSRLIAFNLSFPSSLIGAFPLQICLQLMWDFHSICHSIGMVANGRHGLIARASKYTLCLTTRNRSRKSLPRTHGFSMRMSSTRGRSALERRRGKGRWNLCTKTNPRPGKRLAAVVVYNSNMLYASMVPQEYTFQGFGRKETSRHVYTIKCRHAVAHQYCGRELIGLFVGQLLETSNTMSWFVLMLMVLLQKECEKLDNGGWLTIQVLLCDTCRSYCSTSFSRWRHRK